ncbi:MAG: hypothetical protein C4K48_04185 [Candidatus Thorarchaeota archaeon]|nr:MAG: hypothetical protein C4K48_04185 [Candidatus Thorarchaeota archaeon]
MTEGSGGKRIATMVVGMIVIVGGFFGGFMQFFWTDTHDVGTILLYVLVVPMVSALVGTGIILYGIRDSLGHFGLAGLAAARQVGNVAKEKSYVHEPPRFCKDCGATLTAREVEWVGPLTVKCPYCGATHPTEKREV